MRKIVNLRFVLVAISILGLICGSVFLGEFKNTKLNVVSQSVELETKKVLENDLDLLGEENLANVEVLFESDMGIVEGASKYPVGEIAVLTAKAKEGRCFEKWQEATFDEDLQEYVYSDLSYNNPLQFEVSSNRRLRAVFDFSPYTISTNFEEYFVLEDVEANFVYDNTVFADDEASGNYIRSLTSYDNKTFGTFFYKDVVTLTYGQKQNVITSVSTYYVELGAQNFNSSVSNKKLAVINVDESDKIISTEIDEVKVDFTEDVAVADFEFDFLNFDYIILTQKLLDAENSVFVTTKARIMTKVVNYGENVVNIEYSMVAEKLQNVRMSAVESVVGGGIVELDMNIVKDLIDFEYGYYGILDNTSPVFEFLVVQNNFYKLTFNSNEFFNYKRVMIDKYYTKNEVLGNFSASVSDIVVEFERAGYDLNFYYCLDESGTLTDIEDVGNLQQMQVYPATEIKIDANNLTVVVGDEEAKSIGKIGYKLTKVGLTKESLIAVEDLTGGEASFVVDPIVPQSLDVYLVYELIEYDLTVSLVDKDLNLIDDYARVVLSVSENQTAKLGQDIELFVVVKDGFKFEGWKKVGGNNFVSYDNNYTFSFKPMNNDVAQSYDYLCVVDYAYTNLKYNLDSVSIKVDESTDPDSYTYMGTQSVVVAKYFVFDLSTATLQMFGDVFKDDSTVETNVMVLENSFGTIEPTVNGEEKVYSLNSSLGQVEIVLISDVFAKLVVANKEFVFDDVTSTFVQKTFDNKNAHTVSVVKEEANYSFEIANITIDDLVLLRTFNDNSNYAFSGFVKIENANRMDLVRKIAEFSDGFVYRFNIYNQLKENNQINVVYVNKTGQLYIYSNNENAFSLEKLQLGIGFEIEQANDKVENLGNWIAVSATNDSKFKINVNVSQITAGYKFVGFSLVDEGEDTELEFSSDNELNPTVFTHTVFEQTFSNYQKKVRLIWFCYGSIKKCAYAESLVDL